MKNTKKLLTLTGALVLMCVISALVFWMVRERAYARVEELTRLHAYEFDDVVWDLTSGSSHVKLEYYKVFEYAPNAAKLFVVTSDFEDPRNRRGFYIYLEKQAASWCETRHEGVWSAFGSADGWTWPPYW